MSSRLPLNVSLCKIQSFACIYCLTLLLLLFNSSTINAALPGSLDATFGTGGIVRTPGRYISDAALQADGKLVTAGFNFTVMCYLTGGARDFDYDGDAKADIAVFRPSNGDWYCINSSNSSFTGIHFGVTKDKPAPADYDGD